MRLKKKSAADLAGRSLDRMAWHRFRRNPLSIASLVVIGFFLVVALLGYLITPDHTPYCNQQYLELATLKPFSKATFLYSSPKLGEVDAEGGRRSVSPKRWVCEVCGYVYEGDEVPDDFICPWCKHGKSDFKLVE